MIPIVGPTGNYICPYCGRLLNLCSNPLTKDHIVPRSFWRRVHEDSKTFKKIKDLDLGIPSMNDDRNILFTCNECNRSKADLLIVPSWSIHSKFKYWSLHNLRSYAEYFKYWSKCFEECLNNTLSIYESIWPDSISVCISKRVLKDIHSFNIEYDERCIKDDWLIGG